VDDAELAAVQAAVQARWAREAPAPDPALVFQDRSTLAGPARLLCGTLPEPLLATEDGARFELQLLRGRNHGLFLDMAEGRRWVRRCCAARPGCRVLNLFAYTCAFSVVALQAGAGRVVNLDMAPGPLAVGRRNHSHNGLAAGAGFLAHDLFSSWGKLTRSGPWNLVIVDPPSYQKGSFVATKDYARVLRRLPALLAPGGRALLALNAPELPAAFLHEAVAAEAPGLAFVQRLPPPAAFADADPERALKLLVYARPAA
jgi:23S rRNA (cytosine1962-C5)-methyltransferase